MITQEIIANILFYEKQYLLNGGITAKSGEMQELLGIEYTQDGSHYQFIAKPAPTWNSVQALKVCNLICTYKFAEIVSIDNDLEQRYTKCPWNPHCSICPQKQFKLWKRFLPGPSF